MIIIVKIIIIIIPIPKSTTTIQIYHFKLETTSRDGFSLNILRGCSRNFGEQKLRLFLYVPVPVL